MEIKHNLSLIHEKIKNAAKQVNRDPEEIHLIAVTKNVGAEKIIEAMKCGIINFGENYAQQFRDKYKIIENEAGNNVKWHFIGRLQKNKVKYLIGKIALIHSLDNLSVAQELNKRGERLNILTPVLVEVNCGEEIKGGIQPGEIKNFLKNIEKLPYIKIKGLMVMPSYFENPELARPYFRQLKELRDELKIRFPELKELSMGMSGDFEVAIEEGATMVRMGTAIFGTRS